MTSSIRILTTFTVDSSPAVLLVSPNGDTTLVNCGEGCQRSFLETPGLRIRSVTRVCLTHIGHDAVGGLGGMILSTADVAIAAAANAAIPEGESATPTKRKSPNVTENEDDTPGLDIIGPVGTQAFLHSLRHFMRRDKFRLHVKEGEYRHMPGDMTTRNKATKKKRKMGKKPVTEEGFYVQTVPCVHRWSRKSASGATIETQILSFVFTTPPIPGKFLPDKARELGIPPGPLYAELKNGETVSFVGDDGTKRTVESPQVVAEGTPGVAVAVVYCPTSHILEQLKDDPVWGPFKDQGPDLPILDVMVHMTSSELFESDAYCNWMQTFPSQVEHLWLESAELISDLGHRVSKSHRAMSSFRAAATGAFTRSTLHPGIFPTPVFMSSNVAGASLSGDVAKQYTGENKAGLKVMRATAGLEYKLIPRSKKGINLTLCASISDERMEALTLATESGALELAKSVTADASERSDYEARFHDNMGELIFTGTGSAIPCKHRNVTGMYLKISHDNAMLLDVGEGTVGQLLRIMPDGSNFEKLLLDIKAVWISHPHADHHLGILRLLSERNSLSGYGKSPLVLIAPPNMFAFLDEYSLLDPSLDCSYLPLDCRDLDRKAKNSLQDKLFQDLGITRIITVPVAHCPHSYAVVIDGTPFGRVSYSGDCRPSTAFAAAAADSDLLIHESTFEDGMEEEAVLKRHCTVGEALMIAKRMRAKAIVLTHFSQRYPRIPRLREVSNEANIAGHPSQIVFAFDYMRLTPQTVSVAAAMTPALRLLYPDQEEDGVDNQDEQLLSSSKILSVPGLFAQSNLL